MTGEERRALAARIDERVRQIRLGPRPCMWCDVRFTPSWKNPHQQYCSADHRRAAYAATPEGREMLAKARARYEEKRPVRA